MRHHNGFAVCFSRVVDIVPVVVVIPRRLSSSVLGRRRPKCRSLFRSTLLCRPHYTFYIVAMFIITDAILFYHYGRCSRFCLRGCHFSSTSFCCSFTMPYAISCGAVSIIVGYMLIQLCPAINVVVVGAVSSLVPCIFMMCRLFHEMSINHVSQKSPCSWTLNLSTIEGPMQDIHEHTNWSSHLRNTLRTLI